LVNRNVMPQEGADQLRGALDWSSKLVAMGKPTQTHRVSRPQKISEDTINSAVDINNLDIELIQVL
jgi:hypothetical protein